MATGLYTKNNLSEGGINSKEAVQKLYGPQIQEDILLFSFASRLESAISSTDQITGLINVPLADTSGNVSLRTKFVTSGITFTNDNIVWLDSFSQDLDKRTSFTAGAPVNVSRNGSLSFIDLLGAGERYKILSQTGSEVNLPAEVNVYVLGKTSGSKNALIRVTINSQGQVSKSNPIIILSQGSGYVFGEELELILGCESGETPIEDKCINYTGNYLTQEVFYLNRISNKAYLKNGLYKYAVKFSTRDGFFLYDKLSDEYVYLGSYYNSLRSLTPGQVKIKRKDTISSSNVLQLYNLNGASLSWNYENKYLVGDSLYLELRNLLSKVETLQSEFTLFIQNCKDQTEESDEDNTLGVRYNIVEGKNITSSYRMIFRDPDKVLNSSGVDFLPLSLLNQAGQTSIDGKRVPGIWLWTGEKYQRAYSSNDKPFVSLVDKNFLSPAINNLSGAELDNSGSYKYSINTGYLKPGTTTILGFDTEISTLVQNISGTDPAAGGFAYTRTLVPVSYPNTSVKAWPLFSYKLGALVKEMRVLAI